MHPSLTLMLAASSLAAPLVHARSQVTVYGRVEACRGTTASLVLTHVF